MEAITAAYGNGPDGAKSELALVKKPRRIPYAKSDKRLSRKIWGEAQKLFPYPSGKPWLKGMAMHSGKDQAGVATNMLVPTWRNPVNAQAGLRSIYYKWVTRMIRRPGSLLSWAVYTLEVSFDDWSPKFHEALTRRLNRRGGDWSWIDNFGSRGCCAYFTNVALDGFKLLDGDEAVKAAFVSALRGIRCPEQNPPKRFRPFRGSKNWALGADSLEDEDEGRWSMIGMGERDSQGQQDTDFAGVEIAVVVEGSGRGWETGMVNPYWKFQWGKGLRIDGLDAAGAAEFFLGQAYRLTKYGKQILGLVSVGAGGVP